MGSRTFPLRSTHIFNWHIFTSSNVFKIRQVRHWTNDIKGRFFLCTMPEPVLLNWNQDTTELIAYAKAQTRRFTPQSGIVGMLHHTAKFTNHIHRPNSQLTLTRSRLCKM